VNAWLFLGVASVVLVGNASFAQGLGDGTSIVRDWSGPYVGAGVSYSKHTPTDETGILSLPSASGAELGLLLGYSWQSTNLVYGLEAVANLGNSVGTNACCETSVEKSLAVKGRVGYATGNTLFFGTLGVASDQWSLSVPNAGSASIRYTGVVLSVGAEVALTDLFSVRGEVENYNFQSRRNVTGGDVSYNTNTIRLSMVRSF